MSDEFVKQGEAYYEQSYKDLGFAAQRKYPNEELCRFMGRNFFPIKREQRAAIKILETGCGSGGNIWMLAKEGFDAYGIDLSKEAISLAKQMLDSYNVSGTLQVQDMCRLDFPKDTFDAVVEVFSAYCLPSQDADRFLQSVRKVLKPGGLFFSYSPSKTSDTFTNTGDAEFIDPDTLHRVTRKGSPYYGHGCPIRFVHRKEYEDKLISMGFKIQYSETITKTYRSGEEGFTFVTIEARKE